jgi:uncharacterized membrane protein YhaH (DUF805 family)
LGSVKFQEVFDNWKLALSQYAKFEGRSNRAEYWHFVAFQLGLIAVPLYLAVVLAPVAEVFSGLVFIALTLFGLGTLVPYLAVSSRRLRDTGQNPLLLLVHLVPLIGPIAILALCAQPTAVVPAGPSTQPSKSSAQPPRTTVVQQGSTADELKKLADLRHSGVLTEAEFEAQKAKLLESD